MTPDAFYHQWYSQFSPGDWDDAQKRYTYARYPDKMSEAERKSMQYQGQGFATEKEMFNELMIGWGNDLEGIKKLTDETKKSEVYEVFVALNSAVSNMKRDLSRQRKDEVKVLTPKEFKDAVGPVMMNLVKKINGIPRLAQFNEIPDDMVRKIGNEYRKKNKGLDPSRQEIVDIYKRINTGEK
jgi:hypothetical protein